MPEGGYRDGVDFEILSSLYGVAAPNSDGGSPDLGKTRPTGRECHRFNSPQERIPALTKPLYMGRGTARGGHFTCNEEISGLRLPGGPPLSLYSHAGQTECRKHVKHGVTGCV